MVYAPADLQAWVEKGVRTSTSERTAHVVAPAKRHAAVSPAYRREP